MSSILIAAALLLAQASAAPASGPAVAAQPALPALTPPQAEALRCGVVFALGNRMQMDRKPAAAAWPPLAVKGREFFVRTSARIIDETGAARDSIGNLAAAQAAALKDDAAVAAAMPGCLVLLQASGI